MVTTLLVNLVLALVSTAMVASVAHWATKRFTNVTEVRVASLAVAIGYSVGRYSFSGPANSTITAAHAALAVGSIFALFLIHHWLFRRARSTED
jgi:membrane protein YdbS with pleckstrin-like domain